MGVFLLNVDTTSGWDVGKGSVGARLDFGAWKERNKFSLAMAYGEELGFDLIGQNYKKRQKCYIYNFFYGFNETSWWLKGGGAASLKSQNL